MKILVLNCGSSSLKYQLIDMENEKVIAKGYFERIGSYDSFVTHKVNGEKYRYDVIARDHGEAIKFVLKQFTDERYPVIKSLDEIAAIAHKLLPLFTLIGAGNAVILLSWLEARRGEDFSTEINEKVESILQEIQKILKEVNGVECTNILNSEI